MQTRGEFGENLLTPSVLDFIRRDCTAQRHAGAPARHAMHLAFDAIRQARRARYVVTQAFTCVTAINPIVSAGMLPRYADISPDTLSIDPQTVTIPPSTGAIVLQHTFGIVDDAASKAIVGQTHAANALVVEDSAHCVGRMATDPQTRRPLADISIHSFGAEKVLPTKFGGALWLNPDTVDAPVRQLLVGALTNLPQPRVTLDTAIRTYRLQDRAYSHLPSALSGRLRSAAQAAHLFYPPVADTQWQGGSNGRPYAPSRWVLDHMSEALAGVDAIERELAERTGHYLRALSAIHTAATVPASVTASMPLIRFPVILQRDGSGQPIDPEDMFSALQSQGFYPGRWYRPLLFPGVRSPRTYELDSPSDDLSRPRQIERSIINLRTQESRDHAERLADAAVRWLAAHEAI